MMKVLTPRSHPKPSSLAPDQELEQVVHPRANHRRPERQRPEPPRTTDAAQLMSIINRSDAEMFGIRGQGYAARKLEGQHALRYNRAMARDHLARPRNFSGWHISTFLHLFQSRRAQKVHEVTNSFTPHARA